jgi:hypothetical protein
MNPQELKPILCEVLLSLPLPGFDVPLIKRLGIR